jgi:hypothetical protein
MHTLPKERLEPYVRSMGTAYKGVPEVKVELKAEVKLLPENK